MANLNPNSQSRTIIKLPDKHAAKLNDIKIKLNHVFGYLSTEDTVLHLINEATQLDIKKRKITNRYATERVGKVIWLDLDKSSKENLKYYLERRELNVTLLIKQLILAYQL